jgi:hypothetical protein
MDIRIARQTLLKLKARVKYIFMNKAFETQWLLYVPQNLTH